MSYLKFASKSTALQFLNVGFPIAFTLVLVAIYGAARFGVYAAIFSVTGIVSALTEYGLQPHAIRLVSAAEDACDLKNSFREIIKTKIFLVIAGVPVYVVLCLLIPKPRAMLLEYFLAYFYVIGLSVNPVWYFFGTQKMALAVKNSLVVRIFMVSVIYGVSRATKNIDVAVAVNAVGCLIIGLLNFDAARRDCAIALRSLLLTRADISVIKMTLMRCAPLSVISVGVSLYTTANVLIVSSLLGSASAGYFALGERVARASQNVLSGLANATLAFLSRHGGLAKGGWRKIIFIQVSAYFVCALALLLSAPIIARLIHLAAQPIAIEILRIFAFVFFFGGLASTLGAQFLLATGRYGWQAVVVFIGVLANYPLQYGLGRMYGVQGAAWAACALEVVIIMVTLTIINVDACWFRKRPRSV